MRCQTSTRMTPISNVPFAAAPKKRATAGNDLATKRYRTTVYLTVGIANANLGLLPRRMIAISVAWTFGELVIAALVGAWVYREPGEASIR